MTSHRTRSRDSRLGRFVSRAYSVLHPDTTTTEEVRTDDLADFAEWFDTSTLPIAEVEMHYGGLCVEDMQGVVALYRARHSR